MTRRTHAGDIGQAPKPEPIAASELGGLFACLRRRTHAALAVSGGSDSMALMHLAARWREDIDNAPAITVLTVDHALRPESAREAAFVAGAAAELGVNHVALEWDGPKPASGLQAMARRARYDLMAGYCHDHSVGCIVTAHHLDDQAETVLMRLARGSGVDGLAGMAGRAMWGGIEVLRPLLGVPGGRLQATLERDCIEWIEDSSNRDERFERVRVRNALEQQGKLGITAEGLARSARRLRRARKALETATDTFLAAHAMLSDMGFCRLDRAALNQAPEEIALRAVSRVLMAVGGGEEWPRLAGCEGLLTACLAGTGPARSMAGCRVVAEGDALTMTREAGRAGLPELTLDPGATGLWDRRFRVRAPDGIKGPVTVRALSREGYAVVRARAKRVFSLPSGAIDAIASFWYGGEVVAVPHLGYRSDRIGEPYGGQPGELEFVAEFVNAGFVRQGGMGEGWLDDGHG